MAILKCKMCGGTLDISSNKGIATCEYCGTQQTLPRTQNDKVRSLHERANDLRRQNEFDKAKAIYEQILAEDNEDAETYWSLVLCDYGIEYVEEPSTGKRVPTVHRAHYTSIYTDNNFKMALQYADDEQKEIYNSEAQKIEEIQKGILDISSKEEPFDVFICYKETDASGERTEDSVIATDLYHRLTNQGYKVFFSRITLEGKLGTAYEPYIFAALNSAKVMVVLGTKPEYFEAVWVRNEWSRFLELSKKEGNRTLIPAYKGMNPYDLPKEFSYLQAQDMSKIGFLQDLIAGIEKLLKDGRPAETPAVAPATTVPTAENKTGKSMPKKNVIIIAAIVAIVIAVVAIIVALGLNKSDNPPNNGSDSSVVTTDNANDTTDTSSTDASSTDTSSSISKSEIINLYYNFIKEYMLDKSVRLYDLDNDGFVELIGSETRDDSTSVYSVYEIVDGVVTMKDKIHLGYYSSLWFNTKTKEVLTINYVDPSGDPSFDYMNAPDFVESDTEIINYSNGKISRKAGKTVQIPYDTGWYIDEYHMEIYSLYNSDFDTISMIVNDGYDAYFEYYLEHFAVF